MVEQYLWWLLASLGALIEGVMLYFLAGPGRWKATHVEALDGPEDQP